MDSILRYCINKLLLLSFFFFGEGKFNVLRDLDILTFPSLCRQFHHEALANETLDSDSVIASYMHISYIIGSLC